jgi:hypothetical protein
MTRNRKVATEVLEREYVYADPPISITELSDKYGLARSGVADKARIGGWYQKREEFRSRNTDGVKEAMAEKWAEFQIANYERLMKMSATYLDKFQKALDEGEIKVSTRDMLGIAAMMRTFLGDLTAAAPKDPKVVGPDGEVTFGDEAEAREAMVRIKQLMAGGDDDGTSEGDTA